MLSRLAPRICVLAGLVLAPAVVCAQESASAGVAEELTRLMSEHELDAIGAHEADDLFVAALYVPGSQLLVVSAKTTLERGTYLVGAKQYRDLYSELSATQNPDGKIFVMDMGANGIFFKRRNKDEPFDIVESSGQSVSFNGEWGRKAPISEEDYRAAYASDDERYTRMLAALVAELSK